MADVLSRVTLCNVNFRPEHQLRFDNEQQQLNYFVSRQVSVHNNISYQDRRGTMKLSGYVDNLSGKVNYGFYENEYNGTMKRFYFWILEFHYNARDTTEMKIQLDVIQTWYFNFRMDVCFVERMHTGINNRYSNLLMEDFELGDYITRKRIEIEELKDTCILLFVSDQDNLGYLSGKMFNALQCRYYAATGAGITELKNYLKLLIENGLGDMIGYISIFPSDLLLAKYPNIKSGDIIDNATLITKQYAYQHTDFNSNFTFRGTTYYPKNAKLLQYPYNFLMVSNASGSNVILKFEDCNNNSFVFNLEGVVTQNAKFCLTPRDYLGKSFSYEDGIMTDSFGLCSWNNDNFANWYAQSYNSLKAQSENSYASMKTSNKIAQNNYEMGKSNRQLDLASSLIDTSGNILSAVGTMNIGGAIGGGISGVIGAGIDYIQSMRNADNDLSNNLLATQQNNINTINSLVASIKDAKVQPNTAKGDTSGLGLDVARESNTFFIDHIQIKPEFAERIDLYLQMYGSKVNTVTSPYFNTREKWNFIKTVNARALGAIPESDKLEIERQFNIGLTFWSDSGEIGNYFVENAIRS